MECQRGGFGAAVIHHAGQGYGGSERGGRDHGAVIGGDHGGQEFFDKAKVRQRVHVKGPGDGGFGGGQN